MLRKVFWWVNVLLGLWIAAAPWPLGYPLGYRSVEPAFYNSLIAGLAVAIVALAGWLVEQGVFGAEHGRATTGYSQTSGARAA